MSPAGPLVKICGLTRAADARAAVEAGADYLGVVLSPGFGRSVTPGWAAGLPRGGRPLVAVFVDPDFAEAVAAARTAGAAVLQLHGSETPARVRELRDAGDWRVWKALRVRDPESLRAAAARYAEHVDGLLLDGHHPELPGGAGVRFGWEAVAAVRQGLPRGVEVVVAGGLDAGNVAGAVRALDPDVVDVSSGVEAAPGEKDPVRIRAFLEAARGARAH